MTNLASIIVREHHGIARASEPVRIGVPIARGALTDATQATLTDPADQALPAQFRPLAHWPDGSIKWLLVDALVQMDAGREQRLRLRRGSSPSCSDIEVRDAGDRWRIDTGSAVFEVPRSGGDRFASVEIDGAACLDARGMVVRARGAAGKPLIVRLLDARIEEQGAVRVTVLCKGSLEDRGRTVANLQLRLGFHRGSSALRIECEIWNPRAARHPGGLWDLGDAASLHLADLSIEMRAASPPRQIDWRSDGEDWRSLETASWSLYQDSSGGEQWNSPNHIDARGQPTVTFRGFRVLGASGNQLESGDRASPAVKLDGPSGSLCLGVENFWQNFPKALRWSEGTVSVGLFPSECAAGFELQGGEKKRHVLSVEFGRGEPPRDVHALQFPLEVAVDPHDAAASGAISNLVPASEDEHGDYLRYVQSVIEGPHAFTAKRETIDEFGWRNFGELYADHEAVKHQGSQPFISHYNNQYDFVHGSAMHYLRTGDRRWRELMLDSARHLIDIDIYHTAEDKAGFNGGMFWHTDHHQPAATSTHRTYSRRNARGAYGGGPSNEHNYTSGLLLYFYLTGDREAADAVLKLADWVMAMDDGSRTLLGIVDGSPTGLASRTRDMDFHKPGRGAGNSINALLDAYTLSGRREYLRFAERLIERVIHPRDDLAALGFDAPETRWSYLVFLQVLGKYLDLKVTWGELDHEFWYGRASLLHYAHWMLANEQSYRDQLHKVELPTETWPAHDMRKCHIFHLAARYAAKVERDPFTERAAFFFERSLADVMSFPTAYLTRPQVILCVYGLVHAYYRRDPRHLELPPPPVHDFGEPAAFVPQGARLISTIRRKVGVTARELWRLSSDRIRAMLARV